MLDHVSLRVQDFARALAFYKAALAPIGYRVAMEYAGGAGLGEPGKPDLWLSLTDQTLHPTHLAFRTDPAPEPGAARGSRLPARGRARRRVGVAAPREGDRRDGRRPWRCRRGGERLPAGSDRADAAELRGRRRGDQRPRAPGGRARRGR